MKLWIAAFSAALFAAGLSLGVALHPQIAPDPKAPEAAPAAPSSPWVRPSRELSVHRFADELELSGEQDRELDQILAETHEESLALGRAMKAAHERSRERITALLSEAQRKKLDSLLEDERRKRHDSEHQKLSVACEKILKLDPAAAEALRKTLADARQKRRDGYGKGGDPESARAAWRQAREEQHQAVKKILTPDQYEQYLVLAELER